jgi:oligopeptide transport system ATP-binding protein
MEKSPVMVPDNIITENNREILLRVENLVKYFPITRGILIQKEVSQVKAVDKISFEIYRGETFSLVGESGCGKTTAGRTILQLYRPTSGHVFFGGEDLTKLKGEALRRMRRQMQMIFQDPYASLDPRQSIGNIIGEPMEQHGVAYGKERIEAIKELLVKVGLHPYYADRYPHECSGGQRQRVGIARSLALSPQLVVCDEPISALDVSVQAQVVNLLKSLQKEMGLTYLFIAHDLSMVRHISNRVGVMYLGKIVELSNRNEIYNNPLHPYTQALLSAVPVPDPKVEARRKRTILKGELPSPSNPPSGCPFHTRCPIAVESCSEKVPDWREIKKDHWIACDLVLG